MKLTKLTELSMNMSEEAWSRHSSPWSVYSRFSLLPILSLAFWSRDWLGVWALLPIALAIFWVWFNPRAFAPPQYTDNWASMGTFGERIYIKLSAGELPEHHQKLCRLLQVLSGLGLPFLIVGLYSLNFYLVFIGNLWIIAFKAWFVDRMVWLYLDLKDSEEEYASWLVSKPKSGPKA